MALAATDNVLSGNIKEADGITGQNTNTGSGVKTGHIQDSAITNPKIADGSVTLFKTLQVPIVDLVWPAGYFNGMGGGSSYKWLYGALYPSVVMSPAVFLLATDGYFVLPDPSALIEKHNDWHLYLLQDEVGGHSFSFGGGSLLWETEFQYSTIPRTITHIEFNPVQFCAAYDRTQLPQVCIESHAVWMGRIVSTNISY